jgi:hypothetical protein
MILKYNIKNFNKLFRRILLITVIACSCLSVMRAQDVTVNAKLDSILMFIGGQMDLTFEVSQPRGLKINFPVLTDTVTKYIEIVERGKVDTLDIKNGRIQLVQKYRITSFDSGVHLIPAVQFGIDGIIPKPVETQPLALKVINPVQSVDMQKGVCDIKKPVNTPFTLAELKPYLIYIIGFILITGAIIAFLVWRFNKKLKIPFMKKEIPVDPPHVIALRDLERIKEEKLWQKDQVKKYHSQLTDVLRRYIEVRFQLPALEQTSDEIIKSLAKVDEIEAKNKENLKNILQLADLVKFAKFKPLSDENDLSLINAVFFVDQTKLEEVKSLEEEKKAFENKEKIPMSDSEQSKLITN